ncbi:MAG: phosphate acyltransferase PlsX [Patescibacteria group bacterium]
MLEYTIVVDAMGGDQWPRAPIHGGLLALKELPEDFCITFVGDTAAITTELARHRIAYPHQRERVRIVHASERIEDQDKPVDVLSQKPDSSLQVALREVKEGRGHALVSAGNTGALMAGSLLMLGRIRGVERPAIAATFPTVAGTPCVILDVGANADSRPEYLAQFGLMGARYAELVLEVPNPLVGLMSLGAEAGKGSKLTTQAYQLLQQLHDRGLIHFAGNVEGNSVFTGNQAVIVIEGFAGNVMLKLTESIKPTIEAMLRKAVWDGGKLQRVFAFLAFKVLLTPTVGALKRGLDYERYGGAPLLGIDGTVIKAHGRSTEVAFRFAIANARLAVVNQVTQKIAAGLQSLAS